MNERFPQPASPEDIPKGHRLFYITERGSQYFLTAEGKIQRYRVSSYGGSWRTPRELFVFIPPYHIMQNGYGKNDETFKDRYGENQEAFTQLVIARLRGSTTTSPWIFELRDHRNQSIQTKEQLVVATKVELYFREDPDDRLSRVVRYPVSKTPQVGWRPLDVLSTEKEPYFDVHVGHLVMEVFDVDRE